MERPPWSSPSRRPPWSSPCRQRTHPLTSRASASGAAAKRPVFRRRNPRCKRFLFSFAVFRSELSGIAACLSWAPCRIGSGGFETCGGGVESYEGASDLAEESHPAEGEAGNKCIVAHFLAGKCNGGRFDSGRNSFSAHGSVACLNASSTHCESLAPASYHPQPRVCASMRQASQRAGRSGS